MDCAVSQWRRHNCSCGKITIARELRISKATDSEVLCSGKLCPCYYSQSVHSFPEDSHVRIQLCERSRHEEAGNDIFFDHISLNEACLAPDVGFIHQHKPHRVKKDPSHCTLTFLSNRISAAIFGDTVLGPPSADRLTDQRFGNLLASVTICLLNDEPICLRQTVFSSRRVLHCMRKKR
jgi:hypothetical protein